MATSDSPFSVSNIALAVAKPATYQSQGTGYISFDAPVWYSTATNTAVPVRLVRREGNSGSITVTLTASDGFRHQGICTGWAGASVTFADGETTKIVNVPLNDVTLDGEAQVWLNIAGNNELFEGLRWLEINARLYADDGSEASDGVVLTDPSTQAIGDYIQSNRIIYLDAANGDWDDNSVAGYTSGDPTAPVTTGTLVYNVENVTIRSRPGQRARYATTGNGCFKVIDHQNIRFFNLECTQADDTVRSLPILFRNYQGRTGGNPFANKKSVVDSCYIHDYYGTDNIGAVRLDDADTCLVWNTLAHDAYDVRGNSNPVNAVPYAMHSGIHGYRGLNCVIWGCTFYNVQRGVYQKNPEEYGWLADGIRRNAHLVVRCNIYSAYGGLLSLQNQGAGGVPSFNAKMYENVTVGTGLISASMQEATESSDNLKLYNNTCYQVGLGTIDTYLNVQVWNNLIAGASIVNDWAIVFRNDDGDTGGTSCTFFDFNAYEKDGLNFLVDRYAADSRTYTSVSTWQASTQETGFQTAVVDNPDKNAVIHSAEFIDAPNNDFRLTGNNAPLAGTGRFGDNIGAYRLGHEQIGSTI